MSAKEKTQILIVEDNPGDAHLVRIFLKEANLKHELVHAESFFEATEAMEEKNITLVLLDLSLPDSHGFRTLTKFLERYPKMPVIVLTGLNDEIVGMQSVKAGAQDYLVKGQFDSNLLSRVIRYSLQRHKTQQRLEQYARNLAISEKRYVEAQEMAHFGNWEMDIVTNEMKWSDEAYRIFGFTPGSLSPSLSDYLGYVHPEDRSLVEDAFSTVIKSGELKRIEYRIVVGGRKLKYLANQIKIFYDDITEKILLVGAIQDITDNKRSQQLMLEKNISERSFKIKEEILDDMSFHIRTPLSSILNLSYLLETAAISPQQRENVDSLKTSVNDLSLAVNNLLNFSILVSENINLEESKFKLKELTENLEQLVRIKAESKNISLAINIDEDLPESLIGDQAKINQILYNLLDNAIKFTHESGKVDVNISVHPDTKNYVFSVKDNGIGISSNKLQDILNVKPLLEESEDNNRQLGLPIANKLVQTMQGKLVVESKEGKGSIFTVSLPLKAIQQKKYIGEKPNSSLKILLIEDHFLNQLATKRVLTSWSDYVSVDIAENGLVGVEKTRAYQYDLVLMDIKMPVMDGFEATEKIREKSQIPIVALSANLTKGAIEKASSLGMNDYLAKPFKPKDLYEKIMGAFTQVSSGQ